MRRPKTERRPEIVYNFPCGTSDLIQQFLERPITPPTSLDSIAEGTLPFGAQ